MIAGGFVQSECFNDGCKRMVEPPPLKLGEFIKPNLTIESRCRVYAEPSVYWRRGLCPFSNAAKENALKVERSFKLNPLKASKRGK